MKNGSRILGMGPAGADRKGAVLLRKRVRKWAKGGDNEHIGEVLPVSTDKATGESSFAVPGFLRDAAVGLTDLATSYGAGDMTPEATMSLLGGGLGVGGARFASRAARRPDSASLNFDPEKGDGQVAGKELKSLAASDLEGSPAHVKYRDKFYKEPPEFDDAGNLKYTADGDPINPGARIVGRRDRTMADHTIPDSDIDSLGLDVTGRELEITSDLPRRALGTYNRRTHQIKYRPGLSEDDARRTVFHEIAHAVDNRSGVGRRTDGTLPKGSLGDIFTASDLKQARKIYHEQAARFAFPKGRNKLVGPEDFKYPSSEINDELAAEAVRAYIMTPEVFKVRFPGLAKKIRNHVNKNPFMSEIIQFNDAGTPIVAASVLAAARAGGGTIAPDDGEERSQNVATSSVQRRRNARRKRKRDAARREARDKMISENPGEI